MSTFKPACLRITLWMLTLFWVLFFFNITTGFLPIDYRTQPVYAHFDTLSLDALSAYVDEITEFISPSQQAKPDQITQDTPIDNLLPLLTQTEFTKILQELSGETAIKLDDRDVLLKTRYTFSEQIEEVEQYLYQFYADLGIDVQAVEWEYTFYGRAYVGRNIVAELPGAVSPERVWLVGGHFDTVSEMPRIDAPGADNNGSGTALTLLIAKILNRVSLGDTVRFVHFSGGEQGQWGSQAYVQALADSPDLEIMGYINLDEVGWDANDDALVELHLNGETRSQFLATQFEQFNQRHHQGLVIQHKITDANTRSDHTSFWQAGYPALWATQNSTASEVGQKDRNPYASTVADTVEQIDAAYAIQHGRVWLGTLATLANLQPDAPLKDVPGYLFEAPSSCENIIVNHDFDGAGQWRFGTEPYPAAISSDVARSGRYALRLGLPDYTQNRQTESSAWQRIKIPAEWEQATLRYWEWIGHSGIGSDEQDRWETALVDETFTHLIGVTDSEPLPEQETWVARSLGLTDYRGQEVLLYFNVSNDGDGGQLWRYIDDISLSSCVQGQTFEVSMEPSQEITSSVPLDSESAPATDSVTEIITDAVTKTDPTSTRIILLPTETFTPAPTSTPTDTATPTLTFTPTPSKTPTPIPTDTLTPTPRPTATKIPKPAEGVDLIAHHLEITQGVQDLYNSVRLVAGKRTFVRFHVYSNSDDPESNASDGDRRNGTYWTTARLRVHNGDQERILAPINPGGGIAVRANPNRASINHAFLFELPTEYTQGEISLRGELNLAQSPQELQTANNQVETAGNFEFVPPITLVLVGIGYGDSIYPSDFHRNQLTNWMRQAYPLSQLNVIHREYYYGDGVPTCGKINAYLAAKRVWDVQNGIIPEQARYYGLVYDNQGQGFMRGCVDSSPTWVASGPTGNSYWGWWDKDGSYGDWYAGHELGHAYGLFHSNGCGADSKYDTYPHPAGRISTGRRLDDAVYGLNLETLEIYPPEWHDLMTYCPYMWTSDYTYMKLMDIFQAMPTLQSVDRADQERADRILFNGSFDATNAIFELETPFIMPDSFDITGGTDDATDPIGLDRPTYYIVLLDAQGEELARYPFNPTTAEPGPTEEEPAPWTEHDVQLWRINLAVPYVENTASAQVIASFMPHTIKAGPAIPEVTLLAPNGGEIFADEIVVRWQAEDADDDELQFNVQYSNNDGASWEMVAQYITATQISVPARNLSGSERALFRVMASDGLQTAVDQSDATFTVLNRRPTIDLRMSDQQQILANQSVALLGTTYDLDTGTLDAQRLQWVSDLDGLLGTGDQLTVSGLSIGQHAITLIANDGAGGVVSDTVQIVVVDDPSQVQVADQLAVAPQSTYLDPVQGASQQRFSIDNLNVGRNVRWNATANQPWIWLSKSSGQTPDDLLIGYGDISNLGSGTHSGQVTIFSPDLPSQAMSISVAIAIQTDRDATPIVADRLAADVYEVHLDLGAGEYSALVGLANQNAGRDVRWYAESSVDWIQLGSDSGFTRDDLFIKIEDTTLSSGVHSGHIYLSTPNIPEEYIDVRVLVTVPGPEPLRIFLPMILK